DAGRERFAAANAPILARRKFRARRAPPRDRGAELGRLTERVAGAQRGRVRFANRVVRRETPREPRLDRRDLVAEHPLHEPERPEVLATPCVALAEAERLHGLRGTGRDIDLDDLIAVERAA